MRKAKNQPTNAKRHLEQGRTRMFKRWQGLGIFAILFCLSGGGALAFLMKATPFHHGHNPKSLSNSIIPTNLDQPVNILVLGIDNSGHPHSATNFSSKEALSGNSDTMLLVRLLPATHQINILSIPRDTLVQLPGIGNDKINDANMKGGAQLAVQTVSHLLNDIPIDRFVRVDTESFTQIVNALGGVEVNIPKPMKYVDETQHLYIHFQSGRQVLNGQQLQEYVRFREDALGDIGRIQRQQEVLKILLHKLWQPSTVGQLPQLIKAVHDNVDADLSVGEMLGIAQFLTSLDRQHVNMVMLPGRFSRQNEYALSYWIESPKTADPILVRYFGASAKQVDTNNTDFSKIWLAVANGTGKPGAAAKTVAWLRKHGFNKAYTTNREISSVTVPLAETQIIAQQGNPDAANAVKTALGLGQVQVVSTGDIGSEVTVVVGADLASQINKK